ncbi:MAG: L-histidine N(alpha)-methyltransferase, partial [Myxococcales bacterium]|nr:L-histidine N(alpha)-methyltransferase [Myxococcales bacterium]
MTTPPNSAAQGYTVLDHADPVLADSPRRAFAEEVLVGLSERPKRLPSKYFYDDAGSRLFQDITELDAYYPTRCEREIFQAHHADLLDRFRRAPFNLIDLGAGDGRKTAVLLEYLIEKGADVRYVPIDISEEAMRIAVDAVGQRFPTLPISGLVADYFDGLRWLAHQTDRRNLVLFLGSNIGNFDKPRARAFLRRLWNALNPADRVLIGFDLKKDIEALLLAYNDPQGVTERFNLNLLERINRELGGTFNPDKFRFFSTYNVFSGAMESYLVSLVDQRVYI